MFSLRFIIALLIFIVVLEVFIIINHLYWLISWLDMPMHFLAGFWVALVFNYLNQRFFKLSLFWTTTIMTLSFVALIGVLWEFFEFSLDSFFFLEKWGPFQGGLSDTMSDLFFDLLGGLAAVVINFVLKKEKPVV